ncbi:MAG: serine hydrolase [Lautropia sp.]|nr:serine hydrolase [Lautropia sp.]
MATSSSATRIGKGVAKATRATVTARQVSVAASDRVRAAPRSAAAAVAPAAVMPAVASGSLGDAIGLNRIPDPLSLRSSVALVVDPRSGRILYDKNSSAVLPIASVTKLMTAMVVLDAGQPLDEKIRIESADRDVERFSSSHLPVGSELTRGELLQLALMSSENRAASALARTYPGGFAAFVAAANRKARDIGMWDSVFMDGTGLSAANVSTARDLAVLVARASRYPEIARYSVAPELNVRTAYGVRTFRTTNPMVGNPQWGLTLQKTGFINEAGNCLVMQAKVDGRQLIIVLLDSQGRYSRVSDAYRLRRFIEG